MKFLKIDEKTKKVFMVLCVLFILIILIFGFIYLIIDKYMKKSAKKMDTYMHELCYYKIVNNPSEFRKTLRYYETRSLYRNIRWIFRILIIALAGIFIFAAIKMNNNPSPIFSEVKQIFPNIHFHTIKELNKILVESGQSKIVGPGWLPVSIIPSITWKSIDTSNPYLYVSIAFYILMIILFFKLTGSVLGYIARISRGYAKSKEVFEKNLDNSNFAYNLDNYQPAPINQSIIQPIVQPNIQPISQQQNGQPLGYNTTTNTSPADNSINNNSEIK